MGRPEAVHETVSTPEEGRLYLPSDDLADFDSDIARLIHQEALRQEDRLILIPSESLCPPPVREALASVFTNIYAEGYPSQRMCREDEEYLLDQPRSLSYYRRYGDRRYYKGTEYVDLVEALAQKRAARLFANDRVPAERILVNVQPLSGAAANNAVYEAFCVPGDVVMGMALNHGGHLTHGSPVNRSGKRYKIVPYKVDVKTGRIDYDEVERIARECKPRMIVSGASAYPWEIDWKRLRAICDTCGSKPILLADISHPAGLVVAGLFPSPVGYADVTTLTTHKTMCGPRGAIILTTREDYAKKIDFAVFPGEQGGPHINQIAAKAVAFKYAASGEFRELQKKIVDNTKALADGLASRGLKLAYGGTASHLCLVDLKAIPQKSEVPLRGSIASNILDLCGITANQNTIAGDTSALQAGAVRFGAVILSQRGMGAADMDRLAGLIHRVLTGIETFEVMGNRGPLCRGKIEQRTMEEVHEEVKDLCRLYPVDPSLWAERKEQGSGVLRRRSRETSLFKVHVQANAPMDSFHGWSLPTQYRNADTEFQAARTSAALFDLGDEGLLEVRGEHARGFLQQVGTADLSGQKAGDIRHTLLLTPEGKVIDDVLVLRLGPAPRLGERYLIVTNPANADRVRHWLGALSDGYVKFDPQDIHAKIDGPVAIIDLRDHPIEERRLAAMALHGPKAGAIARETCTALEKLAPGRFQQAEIGGVKALVARSGATAEEERFDFLVHPNDSTRLWNLLAHEGHSKGLQLGGVIARRRLRMAAGLPTYEDAGRPSAANIHADGNRDLFGMGKLFFIGQRAFLEELKAHAPKRLAWAWRPETGEVRRTAIYRKHEELTKKRNIVPFAGWSMPILYTSIGEEHQAVRTRAGLFDISHMGVLEAAGEGACAFLDAVLTNHVSKLGVTFSQYNYCLDPDGKCLDDVLVYRTAEDRYMVVVNAANAEKVWAWWNAAVDGKHEVDREFTWREIGKDVRIRDLKDAESGKDRRVDVALQGPVAKETLLRAVGQAADRERIGALLRSQHCHARVADLDVIVSRTGYTGEPLGYEIFVHPDQAPTLWDTLLEKGKDLGVVPTGLGARDSCRTEAGFPLYGHELAGPHDVTPTEAGYGWVVKRHKPFFVGKLPYLRREAERKMQVVRFVVGRSGAKAVKPGDPCVSAKGTVLGSVTSCTLVGERQVGLAWIEARFADVGATFGVFPLPHDEAKKAQQKPPHQLALGDKTLLPEEARIVPRFYSPGETL